MICAFLCTAHLERETKYLEERYKVTWPARFRDMLREAHKLKKQFTPNEYFYHPTVPPDNNGSERAIRNVKVKEKISGQFKILGAPENFAILRSIIDTAIRNNQNVLQALNVIADYKRI